MKLSELVRCSHCRPGGQRQTLVAERHIGVSFRTAGQRPARPAQAEEVRELRALRGDLSGGRQNDGGLSRAQGH